AQVGIPDLVPGGGPAACPGRPAPGGPGLIGALPVSYSMFPLISTFLLLTLNCHFALYSCPQLTPTGEASAMIGTSRHSKVRASTTIRATSGASASGTESTNSS